MAETESFIAPADADGLWREYGTYMRRLVVRKGVPDQEADDVLSNIVTRLIARDVLDMYDPGRGVTFKAFLSSIVVTYVKGQRDKLGRLGKRELLIADKAQDETGTTWAELFGGAWFDDYSHLDTQQFIDRMRAYLAMVPPTDNSFGLLDLFDELVREVRQDGEASVKAVKEHFGVPASVVKARMGSLQATLKGTPEAPPPSWEVHGATVGPLEVRAAIDALEGAKGIMVAQPLARCGHPLSKCPKGWYHQFSSEEIAAYPHIAIDPQTHRKPAGHVKVAVLHRLHRMLAEASTGLSSASSSTASASVPQPVVNTEQLNTLTVAEQDTPRDLIEAELFRLGATPDKVDYILGLAVQLVPA